MRTNYITETGLQEKSKTIVSAPCKVHLLGEWSVVWGKPALLTTVDLRITITVIPSETRNLKIKSRDSSLIANNLPSAEQNDNLKKIIEPIIKKELKFKKIPPHNLEISSQIPRGAHLGSSAAISVAYVAALLAFLKVNWDLDLINKLAYEAEKQLQGNPSGADNSTIVYGGLIWYRKESEDLKIIQQLPFTIPPKLSKNFILINTGTPKLTTKKMIAQITAVFEKKPKLRIDFLTIQEKLTRDLLTAIKDANEAEVIRIIREGEKNLESIGVASKLAQNIIRKIEKVGGAAKICGAGAFSGPTGVLLCYHKNKEVIEKIAKKYNLVYFTPDLGVEGVRLEQHKIKAVIYDFDDTLVDSDALHIESWEQNLKEHGLDIKGFKAWRAENLIGRSSSSNAKLIVEHYKIKVNPERFYKRKTEIFMKIAADKLKLLPGVLKSIKLFKKMGLRLAIATGSPRKYVEAVSNKLGLSEYFDVIVSAEDITRSKPDPQMFQIASQKLGFTPSECIVIEDATVGVQSAKLAGCKCIAIPNKNVTNQDYSEADLVLNSLNKITKDVIIQLN